MLAPSSGETKVHHAPNLTVHLVSANGGPPNHGPGTLMQRFIRLNQVCVKYAKNLLVEYNQRPDIIHCHEWHGFPAAQQLRELFKIPVVATVHLLQHPVQGSWGVMTPPEIIKQERELCRGADALITVSNSMVNLIRTTHQTPSQKLEMVYNGLDPGPFMKSIMSPEELCKLRESFATRDEKIIIFAGRLCPQKGIYELLASAARVIKRRPNVRYLVAGEPDFAPDTWTVARLRQMMKEMFPNQASVWEKVIILGKITRTRLADLYQVADIAIVPSLYEPFGYAAIEAMAAGLPVIATEVGGLAEIIRNNETGLLVPVHARDHGPHLLNVERLTSAQLELLQDEQKARRLARAGQQHVINTFSLVKMAQQTLAVYRRYARATSE